MPATSLNFRLLSDVSAVPSRPLHLEFIVHKLRNKRHEVLRLKDLLPVELSDAVVIVCP